MQTYIMTIILCICTVCLSEPHCPDVEEVYNAPRLLLQRTYHQCQTLTVCGCLFES